MGFWILAVLAAVSIVIVLGYALFAPAPNTARASAAFDMDVYRDQLAELDKDLARGVIAEAEAERARVEISRRLLEADKAVQASAGAGAAPRNLSIAVFGLIGAVVLGGGIWMYSDLGQPGYADMPLKTRIEIADEARQSRPGQAEVEADMPAWDGPADTVDPDYIDLVAQLRAAVAKRPGDPEGLRLLAQHEARLGNFKASYEAQSALVTALGDAATDAEYAELAEFMILAVNGYVSPEAEEALAGALRLNPTNEFARYYTGLMLAQNGRPDLSFRMWRQLLDQSDVSDPWVRPILAQIDGLAQAAGTTYTPPDRFTQRAPMMPGPSAEDMENAAEMSEEDRAEMINSMVDRLSERLATEGGSAEEWARLISVLGVQGKTERAAAIWSEAQGVFAEFPEQLAIVAQAARQAGVAE